MKYFFIFIFVVFAFTGCSSQDSSSYEGYDYNSNPPEINYDEPDYIDNSDDEEYYSESEVGVDDTEYFNGYECTDDCSGHEAGYDWADEKGIDDVDDCGGNSQSFIEGCESYVEDNY
ncbi:MAG: hypothetical protein NTY12_05290 [Candidatus Falkowbacteria bacterium]|nr:hypothetical protein [Candidatus Falkowbacteria bacterium]